KADVVITNPTHVAVALRYVPGEMSAPTLVAKGAGFVAERIREVAREHAVPLVSNPPLARTLYRDVDLNRMVPPDLFKAVAEVLAYVFSLKGHRPLAASKR
ncbi:MAG: EscU/YscU/HrcU family type III secretion system export apparatus switch protein, partial [Magnetococcales bacterium]|nr:EscU/YscU/HrcU family type III secretion system export apparatus switch protein [Magnetococcales bacterium]